MNKLLAKLYSVQLPEMRPVPDTDDHGSVVCSEKSGIIEIAFKARWQDFLKLGNPAELIGSQQLYEISPSIGSTVRVGTDFKLCIAISREMANRLVDGSEDDRSILMDEILSRLKEVIRTPKQKDQ